MALSSVYLYGAVSREVKDSEDGEAFGWEKCTRRTDRDLQDLVSTDLWVGNMREGPRS